MTYKEFLQEFVEKSDHEKIQIAIETGNFLRAAFEGDEKKAIEFAAILTSIFAAADGKLHDHEAQMFGFCINREVGYDDFFNLSQSLLNDKEIMDDFFDFVKKCPEDVRKVFAYYGLAVCAADDRIDAHEAEMVLNILPELVTD